MKQKKNQNNIKKNLIKILNEIELLKTEKTKLPQIIAVTKNQTIEKIKKAIEAGIKIIAENKIQEAEKKFKKTSIQVKKHFIGHLQTNKTKKAVKIFDVIQTADREKIIIKINEEAKKINKKQKIMLQINMSNDKNKYGYEKTEILTNCSKLKKYQNIEIIGIMMMAPQNKTTKELQSIFKKTKKIQQEIQKEIKKCKKISMGMSGDYKEAVREGSTHLRIGTALFE